MAERVRGKSKRGRKLVFTASEAKIRKMARERDISKAKVYIGVHMERWNAVKSELNLKTNHELAGFLLDRYASKKTTAALPKQPPSSQPRPGASISKDMDVDPVEYENSQRCKRVQKVKPIPDTDTDPEYDVNDATAHTTPESMGKEVTNSTAQPGTTRQCSSSGEMSESTIEMSTDDIRSTFPEQAAPPVYNSHVVVPPPQTTVSTPHGSEIQDQPTFVKSAVSDNIKSMSPEPAAPVHNSPFAVSQPQTTISTSHSSEVQAQATVTQSDCPGITIKTEPCHSGYERAENAEYNQNISMPNSLEALNDPDSLDVKPLPVHLYRNTSNQLSGVNSGPTQPPIATIDTQQTSLKPSDIGNVNVQQSSVPPQPYIINTSLHTHLNSANRVAQESSQTDINKTVQQSVPMQPFIARDIPQKNLQVPLVVDNNMTQQSLTTQPGVAMSSLPTLLAQLDNANKSSSLNQTVPMVLFVTPDGKQFLMAPPSSYNNTAVGTVMMTNISTKQQSSLNSSGNKDGLVHTVPGFKSPTTHLPDVGVSVTNEKGQLPFVDHYQGDIGCESNIQRSNTVVSSTGNLMLDDIKKERIEQLNEDSNVSGRDNIGIHLTNVNGGGEKVCNKCDNIDNVSEHASWSNVDTQSDAVEDRSRGEIDNNDRRVYIKQECDSSGCT